METGFYTSITIFFTVIILLLIWVVIKLNIQFYKEKKSFIKTTKKLREIKAQMSKKSYNQLEQIKLSEEWVIRQKTINTTLYSIILELNTELFHLLSKNNLA